MPDLPAPVAAVCDTFLSAVPDGLVTGLYLRGGIGFGEWVPGHSDVDFVVTLAERPGPPEVAALRLAHQAVAERHGGQPHFDGPHVLASDLAQPPDLCPEVPAVLMHEFREQGRNEISPVGWHELARHGVTVTGPALDTLGIWTDDAVLRAHTVGNLDTYWGGLAEACAAAPLQAARDDACEWVVPGVARLDHLLVTGDQTAKSLAVRWGLAHYPERFHRVLRESLRLREGAFDPQYVILAERGDDVTAFASYVVAAGTAVSRRP
ncbi:MAG: aminoglycoside adenylyltransferase domain-containing protein [Nocardioides sp.]